MSKQTITKVIPVEKSVQDATAAEIEANMLKPQNDESYDPGAAALTLFSLYGPKFFAMVSQLNKKQSQRLLKALVTYPLENIEVNKKNKLEYECFKIADRMLTSKFMTVLAYTFVEEQKRMDEARARKEAEAAKEVSETSDAKVEVSESK